MAKAKKPGKLLIKYKDKSATALCSGEIRERMSGDIVLNIKDKEGIEELKKAINYLAGIIPDEEVVLSKKDYEKMVKALDTAKICSLKIREEDNE